MPSPVIFYDIAGQNTSALKDFYANVFDWNAGPDNRWSVPVKSPLGGAFREDPTELRLYIGVADVAATLEQVSAHGGTVEQPRFEVAGTVVLGLFRDPAGNPLGLIELDGEDIKIP